MKSQSYQEKIIQTAKMIKELKPASVLTGAGISVESGVPPFRGQDGIWEKFDPVEYAHINVFRRNPHKVWNILLREIKNTLDKACPNTAHKALAEMESSGFIKTIITQNIDGLHQAAGSKDVIEFHGNFATLHCVKCKMPYMMKEISIKKIPPLCACGGILRPDCVFFGEMIPPESLYRSRQIASKTRLMIVIGTSATVQPAASIPLIAKKNGAKIIDINPQRTIITETVSDIFINGMAGTVMADLLKAIAR